MNFYERYAEWFRRILPSPFTIAVLLSIFTFFLALFFTLPSDKSYFQYSLNLLSFWEKGLWTNGLLVFAVQMMLMLVLGHVMALTKPFDSIISKATSYCTNTSKSAFLVSFLTILVAYFNWGLGLIFGAIFARKVAESAKRNNYQINYPLVGAAGYVGLMVWHGGFSGSALAKVAEPNHIKTILQQSNLTTSSLAQLPESINYGLTVFSTMNIVVALACSTIIPLVLFVVGKKLPPTKIELSEEGELFQKPMEKLIGAEKLDHSKTLALYFGLVILGGVLAKIFLIDKGGFLGFFTPNNINFLLFGLGILLHGNFNNFLKAVDSAISGVSGILIQFPLYFGIMGIMNNSGLVNDLSNFFVSISTQTTFPIFTFLSAGLVNFFVPSGGGQWAIQGPLIINAALEIGVPLNKTILALAYGDQLTNMLQPFWALPLLGITGLKAKDILPYTLILFLLGFVIFTMALLVF